MIKHILLQHNSQEITPGQRFKKTEDKYQQMGKGLDNKQSMQI